MSSTFWRMAAAIVLASSACGGATGMQHVAAFDPHDLAGLPACQGPPIDQALLAFTCREGEQAWEQRGANGYSRECRRDGQSVAGLTTSRREACVDGVFGFRNQGGVLSTDLVAGSGVWRLHFEVAQPCDGRACWRGAFAASLVGGAALAGGFDDRGRPQGRWTLDDGTPSTVDFEQGNGLVEGFRAIERLECRDGLVQGELVASRALEGGTVRRVASYENGIPHGPFRLWLAGSSGETVALAGRYEHGVPLGEWTLATRTCDRREIVGDVEECVAWTRGSVTGTCDSDACRATIDGRVVSSELALAPRAHSDPLACEDLLLAAAELRVSSTHLSQRARGADHDLIRDLATAW